MRQPIRQLYMKYKEQEAFNIRHASIQQARAFRIKHPFKSKWRYDIDSVALNLKISLIKTSRSLRAIELAERLFPDINHAAFAAELLAPLEFVEILASSTIKTGEVSFFGCEKRRRISVQEILNLLDVDEWLLKHQTSLLRQM